MGRPEFRPQDFIAHQQIWCAFFALFGLVLMNVLRQPLWYAIAFGVFGLMFPYIWLSDQITQAPARHLPRAALQHRSAHALGGGGAGLSGAPWARWWRRGSPAR